MKTWTQLRALARELGLRIVRGEHTAVMRTDGIHQTEAGRVEWWHGSLRECDRVIRVMTHAALKGMTR